jgi:hypothetical protein
MLSGACLCGAVRYEIDGRPRFMYRCYCEKCRAASGAPFANNLIVDSAQFHVRAGRQALAAFESSPGKHRCFCSRCGSPIYSHGEKTQHYVSVRCGTLKEDPDLRVAYHAFVASKAPWVEISDGQPQFAEWPDPAFTKALWESASKQP